MPVASPQLWQPKNTSRPCPWLKTTLEFGSHLVEMDNKLLQANSAQWRKHFILRCMSISQSSFTREKQILGVSFSHRRSCSVHFIQKFQSLRPIVSGYWRAYVNVLINRLLAVLFWAPLLDTMVTMFTWLLVNFSQFLLHFIYCIGFSHSSRLWCCCHISSLICAVYTFLDKKR